MQPRPAHARYATEEGVMLIVCPGAWHSISSILDRFSGRELREGVKAVKTGERWRGWYIEGLGGRYCAFWHIHLTQPKLSLTRIVPGGRGGLNDGQNPGRGRKAADRMRYRREAFEAVCVPFLDQATQVESSGYANARYLSLPKMGGRRVS
jgi:hypothetical protein